MAQKAMPSSRRQLLVFALAALVAVQAAAARPWLTGIFADSESNQLEAMQEQLRENQLRRLMVLLEDESLKPAKPEAVPVNVGGYGYGHGHGYGYGYGYGGESLSGGSNKRNLLAPVLDYSSDVDRVQAVLEAGAAWKPSSDSIELKESGMAANRNQQFHEEGDEVMVGPVPSMTQ